MNVVNTGEFEPFAEVARHVHRSCDFDKYASKVFLPGADQDACYDTLFTYLSQRMTVQEGHFILSTNENVNLVHLSECSFDTGRLVLFRVRADGIASDYVKKPALTRFVFAIDNVHKSLVLLLCYRKKKSTSTIPKNSLQHALDSYLEDYAELPTLVETKKTRDAFIDSMYQVLQAESLEKIQRLFDAVSCDGLDLLHQKITFAEKYTQEDVDMLLKENFALEEENKRLTDVLQSLKNREGDEDNCSVEQSTQKGGGTSSKKSERDESFEVFARQKKREQPAIVRFVQDVYSFMTGFRSKS